MLRKRRPRLGEPAAYEIGNLGHEHVRMSWLRHMHLVAIGPIKIAVAAVHNKGNTAILEAFPKRGTLAVAQCKIQNYRRRTLVFSENEGFGDGAYGHCPRYYGCEGVCNA